MEAVGGDFGAGWRWLGGMMWVIYIMVPLTPLLLDRFHYYDRLVSKGGGQRLNELLRAFVVVGLVLGMTGIFGQLGETRRLILGSGLLLSAGVLWLRGFLTTRYLKARVSQEGSRDAVALAGSEEEVEEFLGTVDPDVLSTWRVTERFDLESGSVTELNELIKRESLQRVIFLSGHTAFDRVVRAVETCELQGVEAMVGASFIRTQVARPSFEEVGGRPMLVFRSTPDLSWQVLAKKFLDFFGALGLIVLTFPLWIYAYVGVRRRSPGAPVLFKQERAGLYGKPFSIYKFRTMVPDAEKMLDRVKEEHGNEVDGPAFKLTEDPRIFPFGQFLRKYSIDELPQLLNVLRGEMSLVGPRPLPVHEIEAIAKSEHRRRLSVKPGITCVWQISGRSEITDFDEWVKMDVGYIDRWSIWEDVKILFQTVPAVLFGKGAK